MNLLETIRARFGPSKTPQFYLGAFGKHPGWDDHLDDLGLETDALLAAKHFIYNQGIGGVLDSGQWESYGEDALPEFDHLLVWLAGHEMLIGRIWSSSDGKGRKRYPMNLCAQLNNGDGLDRLHWIASLLTQWEFDCKSTEDAGEVRQIINDGKAFATLALSSSKNHVDPDFSRRVFAEKIRFAPDDENASRITYAIENYLGPFSPENLDSGKPQLNLKLSQSRLVPQHFRLRADPASPETSIRFWHELLGSHLSEAAPRLFLAPRGQDWLDVIVGLPTAKHLVCIKARPKVLPLTCDIPYGITPELQNRSATSFREFLETP